MKKETRKRLFFMKWKMKFGYRSIITFILHSQFSIIPGFSARFTYPNNCAILYTNKVFPLCIG